MAFLKIDHVKIVGISACVPKLSEENLNNPVFLPNNGEDFIKTTGIKAKRIASPDVCTSDLCFVAADKLLDDLKWDRSEVDVLLVVTQTPDYILPVTSALLQSRLRLSEECLGIDSPLGCSGYVYGMANIGAVMSSGKLRKGLLCVGDTPSKSVSPTDKSTQPLFGDAGAVTAFEYDETAEPIYFHLGTDGSGYQSIIIPHGGYRNPTSLASFEIKNYGDGIDRNSCQLELDGMDVFSFGISKAPKTVNALLDKYAIVKEEVDYFVFHQANMMMNKMIAKKLKLPEEKVPYSLSSYGNTSSATIPLTMVSELKENLQQKKLSWIFCGFGVGLSWGTVFAKTENLVCPDIIEI